MRRSIGLTALVVAGAFGFLLALAVGAGADITNPSEPFRPAQPAQPNTDLPGMPARPSPAPEAASPGPAAPPAPPEQVEAPTPPAPLATPGRVPAREHTLTRSVTPKQISKTQVAQGPAGPFQQAIGVVNSGFHDVGVFLGQVASACKVGVASGAGGPVLVFAVLGMAAALERRRAFMTRWATDEELPEFLYAWGVIAPG